MSVSDPQQTLAQSAVLSGISLMLGVPSTLTLRPAPPETGIVFVRADLPDRPEIRVEVSDKVTDLGRCTGIRNAHVGLQTIEHVLSALAGLRIDNAIIEVTAPEPPILDGSSKPFVDAIRSAGIVQQDIPRRYLELDAPMSVEHENKQVVLIPADSFRVTFVFDKFDRPGIQTQVATFDVTPEIYESEIAPARTFCFEDEVDVLLAAGLGQGASDENVLIVGANGQPRQNGYRFPDELVRHKILDLIGDLYLTGRLPKAHVLAVRSQHSLNLRLVQEIFDRQQEKQARTRYLLNPPMLASEIESILPHRYPFLLVDRIVELEEERRIVGIKNVTFNEEFFRGHFPGHPVMPAVLITEAMAQTAGVLVLRRPDVVGKLAYFMTIENAKFRRPVVPGDQLRMEIELLRLRHRIGRLRGVATVDGQLAAEAEFSFALVERRSDDAGTP